MEERQPNELRERQSKLTSVACWLVLAAVLLGVLRLTSIGAQTTPTLELSSASEVTVPLWSPAGSRGHRLVEVQLGPAKERFLLDTGAVNTVIAPAAAVRAGLGESARPVLTALNASFDVRPLVRVDELSIGSRVYADFEAVVVDTSHLHRILGSEISGIIGMNVLGQTPFEIDFVNDALRIGGSLEAFASARPTGAADTIFSVLDLDGTLVAELSIEGLPARFVIDSGAVPTTVQADRAFERPVYGGVTTRFDALGAEPARVESVVLDSLVLGHVRRRNFVVDLGEYNLLGADFLQGTVLFIDPESGQGVLRTP